ncbi:MAG: ribosome maturation factor RimP [Candidatus Omnitrophota bacterium]|nr:ribosome maturation factor RimP [Candidatus Omnitrophota bacterium]
MNINELTLVLDDLISAHLKAGGLELIQLNLRRNGPDLYLEVLADRPEGSITVGECTQVNNELRILLEDKKVTTDNYILEVSSPGLDRSLKTKNDFQRCKDKTVRFFLNTAIDEKLEWEGRIKEAGPDAVSIEIKEKTVSIPYTVINKAKQKIFY